MHRQAHHDNPHFRKIVQIAEQLGQAHLLGYEPHRIKFISTFDTGSVERVATK